MRLWRRRFLIQTTYRYVVLDGIDQVEECVVVMVLNTLLDLQLARFRQFGQDVLLCRIPQVPGFRTVKILRKWSLNVSLGLNKTDLVLDIKWNWSVQVSKEHLENFWFNVCNWNFSILIETTIKFCLKNWTEEGQDQLVSMDPVTIVELVDVYQLLKMKKNVN